MKKKPTMNKKCKIGIITGISIASFGIIGLFIPTVVRAFPGVISDFLPSLPSLPIEIPGIEIPSLDSLFRDEVMPQLTEIFEEIPGLNQITGLDNLGALGLPDIFKIEEEIEQEEEGYTAWHKINEAERAYLEAITKAELSFDGQTRSQNNTEILQQQVEEISILAQSAAQEDITQNVLKQIAFQQTRQAVISQLSHQKLTDLNLKQDVNNMVLSNVSQTLDKGELSSQAERDAQARARQEITGYMILYK